MLMTWQDLTQGFFTGDYGGGGHTQANFRALLTNAGHLFECKLCKSLLSLPARSQVTLLVIGSREQEV